MPHAQLFAVDELEEPTGALNFICEIPKWTNKKYEVATKEEGNRGSTPPPGYVCNLCKEAGPPGRHGPPRRLSSSLAPPAWWP